MKLEGVAILFFTLGLAALFYSGCSRKYWQTGRVCDNKYFVEMYREGYVEMYKEYLTDSTSFRMYVGRLDIESERFYFHCQGKDSIIIERRLTVIDDPKKSYRRIDSTINKRMFTLRELRNKYPL